MSTPFSNSLSEEEREELNSVSQNVQTLRSQLRENNEKYFALETERSELRELIFGDLVKRKTEHLTDKRNIFDSKQIETETRQISESLANIQKELEETEDRLNELEKKIDDGMKQIKPAQKKVDKLMDDGGHVEQVRRKRKKGEKKKK